MFKGISGSNVHDPAPLVAFGQESLSFGGLDFGQAPLSLENTSSTGHVPTPLGGSRSETNTIHVDDITEWLELC